MRIKWNRHLDGSSSRRLEEGAEAPETEEKKRGPSSSPSIFRIFRRKKDRKRGEGEGKTDGGNGHAPPLHSEIDEDDCASISSVATCSSQPSAEAFHRDRASSLFSSFRLSLPGSKRKKRRIAPTPSETLLNGQENEPQVERYSTPDLRKQSEKLEAPINSAQISLSTSSPSIRQPPKGSFNSAQSLDVQNPESLGWSNAKSVSPSSSKLSKSVSFSDCGDGLRDSSHSKCDNKALRTVGSVDMVEEDCGALGSELPACMSDNLRENKFTSVDDSPSSLVNESNLHKQSGGEAIDNAVMTKTEGVSSRSSEIVENRSVSQIGNILDNIASEIRCYEESNDGDKICSANSSVQRSPITSTVNCNFVNYRNGYNNETVTDRVSTDEKNNDIYSVRVNLTKSSGVQRIETGADELSVPEGSTLPERYDNSYKNPLLCSKENENTINENSHLDKIKNSEVPYLNNLPPKLSVFTAAKELCDLNSCDADGNNTFDVSCDMSSDAFNSDKCDVEMVKSRSSPVQKQSAITNDKHVLCHMKVYENDTLMCKAEGAKVINNSLAENPVTENCSKSLTHAEILKAKTSSIVSDNFPSETESGDLNISLCVTNSKCDDNSEILNFPLKCDSLVNASSALNLKNKISCDQKVPDNVVPTPKYHNFRKDQVVPEFELSLLEFEEVCNKYMSRSNPEFTDCSSIIPLYCYSPKRKSVLDLNLSFTYPNFLENGGHETSLQKSKCADLSPRRSELIKQNMKANSDSNLKNSCQSLTEKLSLPLPPKQWINYENSTEDESALNECTDGVQCTTARGKNLCQEPCLGALPTTVMLDGSDLGGIDTPQQSSTLQAFENKSGREHISIVTAEKQQLSDDRTPPKDMISNVGITISTLSGVLDYSYGSETPSKTSVYFEPEIRDTYRGPRAICDPLVYSTEVTKGLESLGAENYLNGHNFCDIRNVGLCEVINDISCDYVQGGNGLIEISNPYEEETFLLSHRNFVSASLTNDPSNTICDRKDINPEVCGKKEISEVSSNEQLPEKEKSIEVNMLENSNGSSGNKLNESVLNRLTHTEQKNIINKTKSSMIPCRKKGPSDVETKRIETKLKSRKSNSLPRFIKSESHLPVKSNSSHRVLSSSYKDSDVGQIHGKRKDSSSNKPSGNHPHVSPTTYYSEVIASVGDSSELNYNSHREEATICESLEISVLDKGKKTSSIYSSYVLLPTDISESATGVDKNGNSYSAGTYSGDSVVQKNGVDSSKSALSSTDTVPSIRESSVPDFGNDVISSKHIQNSDTNISECEVPVNELGDVKLAEFCSQCSSLNQQDDINCENCLKHSGSFDYLFRRSSLPSAGLHKTSVTSSKESLNSQLTSSSNRGKSRIPRKQPGTRGAQTSTKGPVRPPMWLSKAELTQEIQRLGTLCESRTKELNRLKMETKHVSVGFDAFAALFKYMVEDLNALSVPALSEDLGKTLKQLELTKQDLAYYEREVEEMKSHHCQELNDLSNKLFEVYQSEVAELNAKHQEEVNHLKTDHQKQIEHLTTTFDASSTETKTLHEKMVASLEQEIINQREELQLFQEREIRDLEEKHAESSKLLQEHIEQLQKKCAELKQHSMSMEDAMQKDTDSKLQWVTAAKLDLEKEVESLKAVLEMKNKELHTLRVQNLEMEKQLEELPLAREKIKMLQARAEDLEALMIEKTKLERKLSTENQQIRDTYEKESKVNRRLSMENEELLWRLRQAENSLISGSFSEVPEFSEVEENAATSPTKSPGPQMMSRSVFFTFVDKGENSSHSPRSQYKKITPGFSANYKTSPAKSSKSPPAPSPRRSKSHSEPPQPIVNTSTPRKVAKQALNKVKGSQKRQRSGSDSGRPTDHTEVNFSSVTESMASSVSSESSVFEHRERLLEEHKEHIIHSLEILREQRSTESSADEPAVMGKKWCSDDIKITGELSHLESEDMSRSAEFADPKTYYHMTFPVLKESGMPDCDMEDGCKNSSSNSSPLKEIASIATHSMSENNINSAVEASDTLKVMSASSHAAVSTTPVVKRNSCSNATISAENVQSEAADSDKTDNRWRTI